MKFYLFILFLFIWQTTFCQMNYRPSAQELAQQPLWVNKMFENQPNVFEIDSLYRNYYRTHPFTKSFYTQFYKRWRIANRDKVNDQGFVTVYSPQQLLDIKQEYLAKQSLLKNSNWSLVGPIHNTQGNGALGSGQSNVYSIDQCLGQPSVLYL